MWWKGSSNEAIKAFGAENLINSGNDLDFSEILYDAEMKQFFVDLI